MNRLILITIVLFLLFQINFSIATTWHVGPSQTYTMPSQVSGLVQNNDTVKIDSGIYNNDVAKWTADNLVLTGVNGFARLFSGGAAFGDKAIWVISGNNTTVRYIEFSEATSTSNNGAGIRQEGSNLLVSHCYFHHNEDGILAGTVNPSNIVIEFSEFAYNGYGDGFTHNLYINNIDTLIFRNNYSHHTSVGHELKSRARVNYIFNNLILDGDSGTASRSIDLPNGGTSFLIGNVIQQGPQTQNTNIIGYGLEGYTNPGPHELYAINNTIVNDYPGGSFFHIEQGSGLFKVYNNILAGHGNVLAGQVPTNFAISNNTIDSNMSSFHFYNRVNFDYHLTANSLNSINAGTNPGTANGFSLAPQFEFFDLSISINRCDDGFIDAGAFEFCTGAEIEKINRNSILVYPNPSSQNIHLYNIFNFDTEVRLNITDAAGNSIKNYDKIKLPAEINTSDLVSGIYILIIDSGSEKVIKKIIII